MLLKGPNRDPMSRTTSLQTIPTPYSTSSTSGIKTGYCKGHLDNFSIPSTLNNSI